MKKIYFGCTIAGGRDHAHLYADIVSYIKSADVHILSEIFADKVLKPEVGMRLDPAHVWKRDLDWVKEADGLVMEVTQPSLGVGYEIGKAEAWDKPVLALFNLTSGKRLSPMVSGNPKLKIFKYTDVSQTKNIIEDFVASL